MPVPRDVREAALAAYAARSPEVEVLELLHDSALDGPLWTSVPREGSHRSLVFGRTSPFVQVDVVYGQDLSTLTVHVIPVQAYQVEALSPESDVHLMTAGLPPLTLATTATGPMSLRVRTDDGTGPKEWRTSWVVL